MGKCLTLEGGEISTPAVFFKNNHQAHNFSTKLYCTTRSDGMWCQFLDLLVLDDVITGGSDDVTSWRSHDCLNRGYQPEKREWPSSQKMNFMSLSQTTWGSDGIILNTTSWRRTCGPFVSGALPGGYNDRVPLAPPQRWDVFQALLGQQEEAWEEHRPSN